MRNCPTDYLELSDLVAAIDRQVSSIPIDQTPLPTLGFSHQVQLFYQSLTYQPESAIGSTTDISAIRTDGVEHAAVLNERKRQIQEGTMPKPWSEAKERLMKLGK